MKKVVTIVVAAAFLAGCAAPMHSYQPLVDGDTTAHNTSATLKSAALTP